MGCSTHKVPSWSKVAMRASGGTKVRPDPSTAACTKPMIVSFATPLFHDGSGSMPCAQLARMCGSDSRGSAAAVVRIERREIPERRECDFISSPLAKAMRWSAETRLLPRGGRPGPGVRLLGLRFRLIAGVIALGRLHLLQDLG